MIYSYNSFNIKNIKFDNLLLFGDFSSGNYVKNDLMSVKAEGHVASTGRFVKWA